MRSAALKSKKNLVEGRSFPINLLLVPAHVVLLILTADAFLNGQSNTILQLSYISGLILSTMLLVILKGFYMYSYVARFGLGLALIISGFGKLNDPIGFADILQNYFQDGAFNVFLGELFGWKNYSLLSYSSSALTLSVIFALGEIVLALMLLFNLMYKLGVWLTFGFILLLTFVSWYNYNCESRTTPNQSLEVSSYQNLNEPQKSAQICLDDKGTFGPDQELFFGIKTSSVNVFIITVTLLIFAFVILITQFWTLPNSAGENTAFGILLWLSILVHGILSSWFWIVFLSAMILYLALNFKRFSIIFLKSSLATILVLSSLLFGMAYYIISYEPLTDFRSYAIGNDLKKALVLNNKEDKQSIYVYKDLRNNKERFFSEEQHAMSMIWEDTNYVFQRVHDFDVLMGFGGKGGLFNPQLNVRHMAGQAELNSLIQPVYQAYFQDLVQVRNKKTKEVATYRRADFPIEIEKDTNYTVFKFTGVPEEIEFISVQELILNLETVFVWIVKEPTKISQDDWTKIKELNTQIKTDEQDVIVIGYKDILEWEKASNVNAAQLAYLNLDRSEIQKICRSNLCLMILKEGVVSAKYPLAGLPKYETILSKLK